MPGHGHRHVHFEGAGDWQDNQPSGPRLSHAAAWQTVQAAPVQPQLSLDEARAQLARAEQEVRQRVADLKGRFTALERAVAEVAETGGKRDQLAVVHAENEARELRVRLAAEADRDAGQEREALRTRANALLSNLAPGWAGSDWTELEHAAPAAEPADYARLGTMAIDTDWQAPVIVPLINHPGIYLNGGSAQEKIALGLVTRVVAQTPLKHLAVHVYDPRLRGFFGPLAPLRSAHSSAFPQPGADAAAFTDRMQQVLQDAVRNVELARAQGASALTELWQRSGVREGTLHLVVILDYPYGVDQLLQDKLLRIAAVGGKSGVSLLVCADSASAARDILPAELAAELLTIEAGVEDLQVPGFPRPVSPDACPPADLIQRLIRSVVEESKSAKGPVIPLRSLIGGDLTAPWGADSAESLDAVIGQVGSQPLLLSLRTENPPHPNLLIGGAVGQGKSNLLLDIIYALAARYDPNQLELHLLDFKRGLEFKRFGPDANGENWLPHVKVLSLESNQAFGIAVLRHVDRQMAIRAQLFKKVGANSLDKFRELSGVVMPRLMLVIDEFHVLFEGNERYVDEAVELLDRLAKQGRAYGIHLLLASQTTSGVRGLAIKGDSIYAQFPLRMSLKNTPQESEAILSQGNKAAAALTYRGEVIFNSNFGTDPDGSNVRGLAAYADPDDMKALQEQLWAREHGESPLVFVGTDHAPWQTSASLPPTRAGELSLLIGRPIEITSAPAGMRLMADSDQAVAIVGQSQARAGDVLNAMVRSAVDQLIPQHGSLVLLDGFGSGEQPWLDRLEMDARDTGLDVSRVGREEIASWLTDDLVARQAARPGAPMLVVGVGLQRAREMDVVASEEDEDHFDFGGIGFGEPSGRTGRGMLQDLARTGALNGTYFVGWWSNLPSLEADLGLTHSGVAHYVTVGVGRDDLRTIAGVNAQPIDGDPRVGVFDRNGDGELRVVVPFEASQRFTRGAL